MGLFAMVRDALGRMGSLSERAAVAVWPLEAIWLSNDLGNEVAVRPALPIDRVIRSCCLPSVVEARAHAVDTWFEAGGSIPTENGESRTAPLS